MKTHNPRTTDQVMIPRAAPHPRAGFAALGLRQELLATLDALGYEEPTPIQREAIPLLLAGRDLLGQAATGTGKTAAFALPLLQRIPVRQARPDPWALILVPTRELAMQVAEAVHRYGRALQVAVLPICGGQAIQQQLRSLKRGVDVVVATPGRALDHLRRHALRLHAVQIVVLDEADEMLDLGFAEDIEAILSVTPEQRQTALFSATMPPRIAEIARRHLKNPAEVKIHRERATTTTKAPLVRQTAFIVARPHKLAALVRILDLETPRSALVFCRTRLEVDELTERLNARGYRAEALHGGLSQQQRDRVMERFRAGTSELLVATDVAARGLDIRHLSHVINYDVPSAPESYVHRIGRTGRAGREGVAITIAEPREHRLLRNIEQVTKNKIEIATVPTVADLRTRQLELTRASVEEVLSQGEFDRFRVIIESLGQQFDLMDIAAAAMKLAHTAGRREEAKEEEIPAALPTPGRPNGLGGPRRADRQEGRDEVRGRIQHKREQAGRRDSGALGKTAGALARLYIGAGRAAGVRPGDVVGILTNQAGLHPRAIGAIEIADQFSVIEIPEETAADVIHALDRSRIKGKIVSVRLFHIHRHRRPAR